MSPLRALVLALAVAGATSAKVGLKVALRARRGFLAAPPDQAASRTLATLDSNHDGRVDPSEVAQFAASQGLDAETATKEFASLDSNGDGVLEMSELAVALGDGSDEQPEAPEQTMQSRPAQLMPVAPAAPMAPPQFQATQQMWLPRQPATMPQEGATMLAAGAGFQGQVDAGTSQVNAQEAAKTIVDQLALEEREEQEAQRLERFSAELRANATSTARNAMERATQAGERAAKAKATELMKTLTRLEDAARDAEVEAAVLRAKSKADVRQADELMSVANSALGVAMTPQM